MNAHTVTFRLPRLGTLLFGLVCMCLMTACGTVFHGSLQDVGIGSTPTGARVTIDGIFCGESPVLARLTRKDVHQVRIELDGYLPYETKLVRRASRWIWGDIMFGGFPALVVDALSGALYKLTPDQMQATMVGQTALNELDGGLLLAVVMRPDPTWEKIGEMQALR